MLKKYSCHVYTYYSNFDNFELFLYVCGRLGRNLALLTLNIFVEVSTASNGRLVVIIVSLV